MHGSQSIENAADRWSRLAEAVGLRELLFNIAVGLIAGAAGAHVRLHLGLSGHKIVFWLIPVLSARLVWRCPLGATSGAAATTAASFALGGNLAGGVPYMAMLVLAGGVMDALVAFTEKHRLSPLLIIPLLTCGGMIANLLCAIKRLLAPVHNHSMVLGLSGPLATIVSYAIFGLLAGLIGSIIGLSAARFAGKRERDKKRRSNP